MVANAEGGDPPQFVQEEEEEEEVAVDNHVLDNENNENDRKDGNQEHSRLERGGDRNNKNNNSNNNNHDDEGYDSDQGPPQGEDADQLNWRLDPDISLSDWVVSITWTEQDASSSSCDNDNNNNNNKITTNYHVHKAVLALGSRKSHYFKRLFRNQDVFVENASHTSVIDLHKLAADAFPIMLDYVYGAASGKKLQIQDTNATALYFLAQYFENPQLRWDVKQFWKRRLDPTNCHIYYQHATIFRDDKILHAVEALCVANPKEVCSKNKALFQLTDPRFWLNVLAKYYNNYNNNKNGDDDSDGDDSSHTAASVNSDKSNNRQIEAANGIVGNLCQIRANDLDASLFAEITNDKFLPVVEGDLEVVQCLLALEKKLVLDPLRTSSSTNEEETKKKNGDCNKAAATNNEDDTTSSSTNITSLEQRCIEGLAHRLEASSQNFSVMRAKEKEIVDYLQQHSLRLLSRFLLLRLDTERSKSELLEMENKYERARVAQLGSEINRQRTKNAQLESEINRQRWLIEQCECTMFKEVPDLYHHQNRS